jgi:hypothetical protein
MFYGGKLLSHLSAGETDAVDDGLNDLIQLRSLNRHVAVVMDSDLSAAGKAIRPTKARVAQEIGDHGGFVWVTAGREVENYVPRDVLSVAVEAVAPGRGASVKGGRFTKALPLARLGAKQTVDKVATANKVAEAGCALDAYDLRVKVRELAAFIRRANGLAPL